jgi:L-ascorbate metabolism protein UlaG (beta-lactamase superfamily)
LINARIKWLYLVLLPDNDIHVRSHFFIFLKVMIAMKIDFFHVGAACFVLSVENSLTLACDPALSPSGTELQFKSFQSVRTKDPIVPDGLLTGVQLWMITHAHEDHVDQAGVSQISPHSSIITEKNALPLFAKHGKVSALSWHRSWSQYYGDYEVEVTALPAYHGNNWLMRTLVGAVNGYYVSIKKGNETKTMYITSDTVYHPRIAALVAKHGAPDVMIANLGEVEPKRYGGPLTMSAAMLRRFHTEISAGRTIPIHIDDFSHYTKVSAEVEEAGFPVLEQGVWHTVST